MITVKQQTTTLVEPPKTQHLMAIHQRVLLGMFTGFLHTVIVTPGICTYPHMLRQTHKDPCYWLVDFKRASVVVQCVLAGTALLTAAQASRLTCDS